MAQARTKREFDASWPQVWQVAGRIDQVPRPGDYVTSAIGRDSVVAVRSSDAEGRVFDNVCQYRGNRLLHDESGSLAGGTFQCAYHGWRYIDVGCLDWVYDEVDFSQGSPCGVRNLVEIASDT